MKKGTKKIHVIKEEKKKDNLGRTRKQIAAIALAKKVHKKGIKK